MILEIIKSKSFFIHFFGESISFSNTSDLNLNTRNFCPGTIFLATSSIESDCLEELWLSIDDFPLLAFGDCGLTLLLDLLTRTITPIIIIIIIIAMMTIDINIIEVY